MVWTLLTGFATTGEGGAATACAGSPLHPLTRVVRTIDEVEDVAVMLNRWWWRGKILLNNIK